ncbi:MAG: leucyl aminopeptidase [Aestuariivirga sp.]
MKIAFSALTAPRRGTAVLFAAQGAKLQGVAASLDKAMGGQIAKALKAAKFDGAKDQTADILAPGGALERVFVVGLGDAAKLETRDVEYLGGSIAGMLQGAKVETAEIAVELPGCKLENVAALMASGAKLRNYAFDSYKSKKNGKAGLPSALTFLGVNSATERKAFIAHDAVAEGVHMARNLVNEPPNVLFPVAFANRIKALAKAGLKIDILTPAQMNKMGMNALMGVALGSAHEPRLVVMRWNGGRRGEKPVAFIGKGVTFDTGGISIKPAAGMEDMKGDMGGAACVTGLMLALAKRRAKVNAIGAVGLVENMPDGKAQRPGDVVKSMSGQTIAVLNTDAEGRLVLADVLWYIQSKFKPKFMIDLATLTGAILVALGKEHAGLFSNNDELSERLAKAGLATGEKVWRLPLTPEYDKIIDHDVADVKNTGGRFAGSITAAQFLQRFVNNVPWAHLDIAGTAMDAPKTPINQSWGSGWGVRLLNRLVADHYEARRK